MKAYIQTKSARPDGTYDSYMTLPVLVKETAQPGKGRTVSGYGSAIPTPYVVYWNGCWQRVKVIQYGNAGTAYIGRKFSSCLTVDIWRVKP